MSYIFAALIYARQLLRTNFRNACAKKQRSLKTDIYRSSFFLLSYYHLKNVSSPLMSARINLCPDTCVSALKKKDFLTHVWRRSSSLESSIYVSYIKIPPVMDFSIYISQNASRPINVERSKHLSKHPNVSYMLCVRRRCTHDAKKHE